MESNINLENLGEPLDGFLTMNGDISPNSIVMSFDNETFKMELKDDGKIYINDNLVEEDINIVNGLKQFLIKTNLYGTN